MIPRMTGYRWGLLLAGLAGACLAPGTPAGAAPPPGDARPVPGAGHELGIPADGLDRVRLDDGRVLSCRMEPTKEGPVRLHFATFTATVAKDRIAEVRRFADYDSTPRNDEEKASAARGLVRFGGRWISKEAAEKAVLAEKEAARKFREEDDFHAKWENRWQIDTPHFHIEANIPREAVDYYANLIESFYDFFTRAFQIQLTQREKKKKLPFYLFRRRDEFRKFHDDDTGGKSENLLGYFVPMAGKERLVFFDIPDDRRETVSVMFHEGTHFILHLAEPQVLVSRWIHEGCAEYFGGSKFDGKRFHPGLVQDGRLLHFQDMIATDRVRPMEELMRAGNPYQEGEAPAEFGGEHYAQAWTLVHFLMEGKKGKYRAGFVNFLQKHLDKKAKLTALSGSDQKFVDYEESKPLLLRCLGLKDFDGLMKELKEYAMALPLQGAEAYARRGGDRYYARGDHAGSEEDFAVAEERGRDDPAVQFTLARVYLGIPEKSAQALLKLRRSLELDPLNADVRFFLARMLPPAEALAEIETCLQVNPDHALALADYAWLVYVSKIQDPDRARGDEEKELARKGIAAAERAVLLDPSAHACHALASLRLTLGEFAKALEAEKAATEMEPEDIGYLWRLAQCHALLGQGEDFARILRRIEVLMRRAARPAEGETAREGAPTAGDVQAELATAVRRMSEKCLAWELRKEAAMALDAWYGRRLPKTEDDWVFYADVVAQSGDAARSARIATDGLKAFPDSYQLKSMSTAPPAGTDGGPGK
jgi:tetratricopeptide (TPR) repeat protein